MVIKIPRKLKENQTRSDTIPAREESVKYPPLCPAKAPRPPVLLRAGAAPTPTFWPFQITASIPWAIFLLSSPKSTELYWTEFHLLCWEDSSELCLTSSSNELSDCSKCGICLIMIIVWDHQPADFESIGKEYFHQNVSCKIHKQLTLSAIQVYFKEYKWHKFKQLWPIIIDKEEKNCFQHPFSSVSVLCSARQTISP